MGKIQQYKSGLGAFISSEKGQRFFNFAYSIGAAIVIWGALFKILHLPGGNMLLSIGMGTEVLMFVLTAFDRPPREYHWENVFPNLDKHAEAEGDEPLNGDTEGMIIGGQAGSGVQFVGGTPGQTIVVGGSGSGFAGNAAAAGSADAPAQPPVVVTNPSTGLPEINAAALADSIQKMGAAAEQISRMADLTEATQHYLDQISAMAAEMAHLQSTTRALNNVSEILLHSYNTITENSEAISESARGYVERMQALDRNVSGLNTIYEIQLKSISSQLDSIDRVNRGIKDIRDMYEKSASTSARYCEETERMARYMQQLNAVYEKMLTAMTVNMYHGGMPAASSPDSQQQ